MAHVSEKSDLQFRASDIRDILKSKAHCLRAGFAPDDLIIQTLNEIRNDYIHRVGLSTYLSQMLGHLANAEMQYCSFFHADGHPVLLHLNGSYTQPVQRFIARHFQIQRLPFKVEFQNPYNPEQIETRYL
jgi:hypothetical protein